MNGHFRKWPSFLTKWTAISGNRRYFKLVVMNVQKWQVISQPRPQGTGRKATLGTRSGISRNRQPFAEMCRWIIDTCTKRMDDPNKYLSMKKQGKVCIGCDWLISNSPSRQNTILKDVCRNMYVTLKVAITFTASFKIKSVF